MASHHYKVLTTDVTEMWFAKGEIFPLKGSNFALVYFLMYDSLSVDFTFCLDGGCDVT